MSWKRAKGPQLASIPVVYEELCAALIERYTIAYDSGYTNVGTPPDFGRASRIEGLQKDKYFYDMEGDASWVAGNAFASPELVEQILERAKKQGAKYYNAYEHDISLSKGWYDYVKLRYPKREPLLSTFDAKRFIGLYRLINDLVYLRDIDSCSLSMRQEWEVTGVDVQMDCRTPDGDGYSFLWDRLDRVPCNVGVLDSFGGKEDWHFLQTIPAITEEGDLEYGKNYEAMLQQVIGIVAPAISSYPETSYIADGARIQNRVAEDGTLKSKYKCRLLTIIPILSKPGGISEELSPTDVLDCEYSITVQHTDTSGNYFYNEYTSVLPTVPDLSLTYGYSASSYANAKRNKDWARIPVKHNFKYYDPPESQTPQNT